MDRGAPHAAVIFWAHGVGNAEVVGGAVDGAGYAVRVFDCRVVVVGPG